MFFGTTPQIVSKFIHNEIQKHNPKRVFVLFAGNFVIEQITGIVSKEIEIHSTDVSLYSLAIGYGFANQKGIVLTPHALEIFPELKDKQSPIEIAAICIFLAEVAKNFNKDHIAYYKAINDMAKNNYLLYISQIEKKLQAFQTNLGKFKFYGQDACEVLKQVKKGDLVFYDPPVLLGDYEKMFKPVEQFFSWAEPTYTQMTDSIKEDNLQYLNKIGAIVYYRRNDIIEAPANYKEVFRYQYKWTGFYSIYSNKNKGEFVGKFIPLREKIVNYELMGREDIITENSKIEFVRVEGTVANHYRLLWVKKAKMTSSGFSFIIFCDGKLLGLAVVESGLKFGSELVLILSDPCVPGTRYKRLSRLVLYLILNKEFLKMVNDKTMWEHVGFTTRVFSNDPVSMKYRGLMKLAERKEEKTGYKYCLIYHKRGEMPETVNDGLKLWLEKCV